MYVAAIADAVADARRIVERTDGIRLQVEYGKDETALVELWRVHAK
jgi:hypothetical protein